MLRRWYERRPDLLEQERQQLEELGFLLDQDALDRGGTVRFTGDLRLDEHRHLAEVILPPAFDCGADAIVRAPGLAIGRHIGPDGSLCLDHPTDGHTEWLRGAEAVTLAQSLWQLSIENPDGLRDAEARAPDPYSQHVAHELNSAVIIADADVTGAARGVIRIGLSGPSRGALIGLRVDAPDERELDIAQANRAFAGPAEACGLWTRIDAPPPVTDAADILAWATGHHGPLVEQAITFAAAHRQVRRRHALPAVIGFVYPNEVSWRTYGDAWLLLFVDPDGSPRLPRPVPLDRPRQFARQPKLEALAHKAVAIFGLGALGSPAAVALARAGVGRFVLIDHDLFGAGNVVRHDLDLASVGSAKVAAVLDRMRRINPFVEIVGIGARFGEFGQRSDDQVFEALSGIDAIVNTTANASGIHHYLSLTGRALDIPVVHAWVGPGAWGARILTQRAGSGCTECMARHQDEGSVPRLAADPDVQDVVEDGCGEATFTGVGFDLADAAAATARATVGVLADDPAAYPAPPDLLTLTFRTLDQAVPTSVATAVPTHPDCGICHA